MAKENPTIGTCPCPFKGCTEAMKVKRFAARTENPIHVRKAGKLYADCPVHGRFGVDASKATQDYLLENSDIWDPEETERQRAAAAAAAEKARQAALRPPSRTTVTPPAPKTATPPAPASAAAPKKPDDHWNW